MVTQIVNYFAVMRIFFFFLLLLCTKNSSSQEQGIISPIDTFESKIELQELNGNIVFKSVLRPLVQVPGGRAPYYKYLWDFGDGHFSTLPEPTHQYAKAGEYEVSLYAVNNYDDGPKPKRPKRKVKTNKPESALASNTPHAFEENFFASNGVFQIYKLSDAKPGEDIALVVGVHTAGKKGKIYILSNEKIAGLDGFKIAHQSNYYNEQIDSIIIKDDLHSQWASVSQSTFTKTGSPDYGIKEVSNFQNQTQALDYFKELYGTYNSLASYDIDNSQSDTQFALINMDVTENMLVDTNAIVTITGVFIPEDGIANVHQVDIPVVKSHDPNKMSIRPARMNYRFQSKKKTMTYKVQFQNDGEGDAKNIRLEMMIPEEIVKNTFKLKALYPEVDSCATANSRGCYLFHIKEDGTLVFQFKDIALPGTASKVLTDMDSTKGFILFEVETQKKLKNKSFNAYTNIYFDKNPPIKTNTATTRFLKTLSPFVTIGASSTFGTPSENNLKYSYKPGYQIGFGIAPTAPYKKPYWQIELYTSYYSLNTESEILKEYGIIEITKDGQPTKYEYSSYKTSEKRDFITVQVPVQIRYNLNPYLSFGIGASLRKDLNIKYSEEKTYFMNSAGNMITSLTQQNNEAKSKHSDVKVNPFLDINLGSVNLGPALGFRISYDKNQKTLAGIYGIFRF